MKSSKRASRLDSTISRWATQFVESPAMAIEAFTDLPRNDQRDLVEKISKEHVSELLEVAAALPNPKRKQLELFLRSTPLSGVFSDKPNKALVALQSSDDTVDEAVQAKGDLDDIVEKDYCADDDGDDGDGNNGDQDGDGRRRCAKNGKNRRRKSGSQTNGTNKQRR